MAATRSLKSFAIFAIFVALLFLSNFAFFSQARPLTNNGKSIKNSANDMHAIEVVLNRLIVAAIKTGGPSPGGGGHMSTTSAGLNLGEIKKSGPSPGGGGN
ncbi:OLC1v1016900C1 [Oldenlandia corymbosa var. corymbosa]|uniref:OLC1v1016900C1 n=1 Tax=Oldenlandia corymbosa var. corymbosa TaxID=529605 RepID=A0AAV1E873_OLDCO|nr:OLC1v1016900C1 [Oldenlandia corymbosa var. corymbosa]